MKDEKVKTAKTTEAQITDTELDDVVGGTRPDEWVPIAGGYVPVEEL